LADCSEPVSEYCAEPSSFSDFRLEPELHQDWPAEQCFPVCSGCRSCFAFRHAKPHFYLERLVESSGIRKTGTAASVEHPCRVP
jgi:hypothetical protein